MKITLLLIVALSCLVLSAVASPIQIVEAPKDVATTKDIPVGRQQQGAAGVEEDDDDDDDDDDIDDVLDDDDDDDDDDSPSGAADDDDDDDDDDDYLERFFDDILGEEDDDDDDDDVSPSTGVQQAQQQATQAVAQQAAQDNLSESVDYTVDSTGDVEDGLAPINDEINIQALDQSAKDPISQVAVQPLDDDDDDDDDEEDEIEDALDVTDDDDDDDDDDDLIGDDVIEARNGEEKRSRALKEAEATPVPEIVIQKYNQFVDRIYERINKVLRKSYDPVTVHLTTSTDNKLTANKTKKTNKNKKRNNNNNKLSSRIGTDQLSSAQNNATTSAKPVARKRRDVPAAVASKDTKTDLVGIPETFVTKSATEESAAAQKRANVKPNANKIVKKEAAPVAAASKQADNRGRGTLYGLSSMRRSGDVRVNAMADFTTVKSNFILGPLILKVEKQFGKSGRRELRVATARTQEMLGRINLRIVNGSAVLHSIKVQQPKQVSIQSKDNHDKTREYLWKRSSHIAHLVSEKLSTAARAMLKPQTKRAASQT